jgi:hypothetical protein
MSAPTDPRAAAAGEVFFLVASDLWSALRALNTAVGAEDHSVVTAAAALVAQAGALADDAAEALGATRMADRDDWHRSDMTQQRLAALQGDAA